MDFTEKIIWTILFGLGGLILPIIMGMTNDNLKNKLEQSNPELVKNQSWFFSETKKNVIKWIILIILTMLIGLIIMIWTTNIKIDY